MNNKIIKTASITLCTALVAGSIGYSLNTTTQPVVPELKQEVVIDSASIQVENLGNYLNSNTLSSDETVYAFANANGAIDKTIVSTIDKNNKTTQESSSKALPIEMKVTYTLDGKNISPNELVGKSGRVNIKYQFTNKQSEEVTIAGEKRKVYVPFTVITGILLDNDVFSNVTATNAEFITDGSSSILTGITFPGLNDSLKLSGSSTLPDYFEFSADVKNFSYQTTYSVATNQVVNKLAGDKNDSKSILNSALDTLRSNLSQIDKLTDGIDQLEAGAKRLSDGLSQLTANNDALNGGAYEVFNTLLNVAYTQITAAGLDIPELTIYNYTDVLNGAIDSLDPDHVAAQSKQLALETVTTAVNQNRPVIEAKVTEAVKAQVIPAVKAAVKAQVTAQVAAQVPAGTPDAYIENLVNAQMETASVVALINQNVDTQMASDEIKATIAANVEDQVASLLEQNMNSSDVQDKITEALAKANSGAASISEVKSQLDSYNTFYTGLAAYTQGVATASEGSAQLVTGVGDLRSGVSSIIDKLNTISNASKETFDAVINVSKNYTSFTGKNTTDKSSVLFIYRTKAIN